MTERKRVLICHERFLPRFGADRVLVIIGQKLAQEGWSVDFMGRQFADDRLNGTADRVIDIPAPTEYARFDVETVAWLESWVATSSPKPKYDLVIVGGWPFFSSIPVFRRIADRVLFIDCGVVPNDGYDQGTCRILDHLRELRRNHLVHCTHIAANSRFTLESQTLPDTPVGGPARAAVLNGIDHLMEPSRSRSLLPAKALLQVRTLRAEGRRPVLLLGRFEKRGYKNSLQGLEVCRLLRRAAPEACLLLLDQPEAIPRDWELDGHVFGLGFPDDQTLVDVMAEVDLGLSVSLWEGFNLPIAEMYRLAKPALCFDLAAHSEVVLRPWFLCRDYVEMAAKAAVVLSPASQMGAVSDEEASIYRERFTWANFMKQLHALLQR